MKTERTIKIVVIEEEVNGEIVNGEIVVPDPELQERSKKEGAKMLENLSSLDQLYITVATNVQTLVNALSVLMAGGGPVGASSSHSKEESAQKATFDLLLKRNAKNN